MCVILRIKKLKFIICFPYNICIISELELIFGVLVAHLNALNLSVWGELSI
jgi:hypothetical protein